MIRELANSRAVEVNGAKVQFPWSTGSALDIWVAAYGPLALKLTGEVGDGFILQLADPDIAAWTIKVVRDAAEQAGRDPDAIQFCVAAPDVRRRRPRSTCASSAAGSAAWSATTSPTSSPATAPTRPIPKALTDYIAGREGYDYNEHGRAGNTHAAFVPDEIVERFCILGSAAEHVEKLEALRALGVTQFAGYLQHDNKEETLRQYGEHVIPGMATSVVATG